MSKLSLHNGLLTYTDAEKNEKEIALSGIKSLIIETGQCSITSALLGEMAERGISVLLCDRKHIPVSEIGSFVQHNERAGKIMDQALWPWDEKAAVWEALARQKITNQAGLLTLLNVDVPEQLEEYSRSLNGQDEECAEGKAAGMYFRRLFGMTFRRHAEDAINAALNYGYSIVLSEACRIIREHGYITELGIHHCSRVNPYNLACDLMEPFRPFVDEIVFQNVRNELDGKYKKEVICVTEKTVRYRNEKRELSDAMEMFFLDIVRSFSTHSVELGDVTFER